MRKVKRIERIRPRPGGTGEAIHYTGKGYQLRAPDALRLGMNKAARATFVMTLDDDVRMGRPGVRASYIAASGLNIVR